MTPRHKRAAEGELRAFLRISPLSRRTGSGTRTARRVGSGGEPGGLLRADELQDLLSSAAEVSSGCRDVGRSNESQQADGDIAEAGQRPRTVSLADLAPVFVVSHVTHVVETIFNVPVLAVEFQEPCGRCLLLARTRDAEANLGHRLSTLDEIADQIRGDSLDTKDLLGVRKLSEVVEFGA